MKQLAARCPAHEPSQRWTQTPYPSNHATALTRRPRTGSSKVGVLTSRLASTQEEAASAPQTISDRSDHHQALRSGGLHLARRNCREACKGIEGIEQLYYRWRKQYGVPKSGQVKRMEEPAKESGRLRGVVSKGAAKTSRCPCAKILGMGTSFSWGWILAIIVVIAVAVGFAMSQGGKDD